MRNIEDSQSELYRISEKYDLVSVIKNITKLDNNSDDYIFS